MVLPLKFDKDEVSGLESCQVEIFKIQDLTPLYLGVKKQAGNGLGRYTRYCHGRPEGFDDPRRWPKYGR